MLGAASRLRAQDANIFSPEPKHAKRRHAAPPQPQLNASQPAAFSIATEPLGFSAPSFFYLGMRSSMASLDFLDENRLLFTFRVPGLIPRSGGRADEDQRRIRALVLDLPSGAVEVKSTWTVHGRDRYLWALDDGHFLLRDRDLIYEGDGTLTLKPLFRFPGPLLRLEIDPTETYLVTNSFEPEAAGSGDTASPPTVNAGVSADGQPSAGAKNVVVRMMRWKSGEVLMVSRTHSTAYLPISDQGFLETLPAAGGQWLLSLDLFTGESRILGRINSACQPTVDFVSRSVVLAATCDTTGGGGLVAITAEGHILWENADRTLPVWPLLAGSSGGLRFARESLSVTHAIDALSPLDPGDIRGQRIEVFDTATGKAALTALANPVLDAGGNVAISPSGRRVAIVTNGAIQIFELPPPPPLPAASVSPPAR